MIYKVLLFLAVLSFTKEWYLYSSKELNFSILFPKKPEVQEKKLNSDIGTVQQSTVFLRRPDSTAIEYQIIVSSYSPEVFEGEATDSLRNWIQSTISNEMLNYLNGELIYENDSELKGVPCSWYLIRYHNKFALKSCMLWDGNRLISIMHYSHFDNRLSTDSDYFFNNFSLLSKK